jgi:hypothetical protein
LKILDLRPQKRCRSEVTGLQQNKRTVQVSFGEQMSLETEIRIIIISAKKISEMKS